MCDYDVVLEKEVLNEMGAGILADFSRFLDRNNISIEDKKNPVVILFWETVLIKNNIIGTTYDKLDELKMVEGQLNFVKKFILRLGEIYGDK